MKKILVTGFVLFFVSVFSMAQKNKRVAQGEPFSSEANTKMSMGGDESVSSNFTSGVKQFKDKNYKSSLEYFNSYLTVNPEDVAAHYNRGLNFYFMEEIDHACMDWKFASYFDDFLSLRNYESVCDSSFDAVPFLNGGLIAQPIVFDEKYKSNLIETSPSFPGGQDDLNKFLQKNLSINPLMRKKFLESRIVVKFSVKEDGSISNPSVVGKKSPELEAEAIRVVNMMPDWKPAKGKSGTVASEFYYPVINGRDSIRRSNKIYNEGVKLFDQSNFKGALKKFAEVLSINDGDVDAYYQSALCHLHMGDTASACIDLNRKSLLCQLSVVHMLNEFCHENISLDSLPTFEEAGQGVFTIVEQMPVYPGGEEALLGFLGKNLKYPDEAKNKNISGRIFVSFIIDKEGFVREPKILKGKGGGLDEEALRVVKLLPQWKPGYHSGRARNVQFNLPISFSNH